MLPEEHPVPCPTHVLPGPTSLQPVTGALCTGEVVSLGFVVMGALEEQQVAPCIRQVLPHVRHPRVQGPRLRRARMATVPLRTQQETREVMSRACRGDTCMWHKPELDAQAERGLHPH